MTLTQTIGDATRRARDAIDELVDWQLIEGDRRRRGPLGGWPRRMFEILPNFEGNWSGAAKWSAEDGWGYLCSDEFDSPPPDYWH